MMFPIPPTSKVGMAEQTYQKYWRTLRLPRAKRFEILG